MDFVLKQFKDLKSGGVATLIQKFELFYNREFKPFFIKWVLRRLYRVSNAFNLDWYSAVYDQAHQLYMYLFQYQVPVDPSLELKRHIEENEKKLVTLLEKCISMCPDEDRGYFLLSSFYFNTGKFDRYMEVQKQIFTLSENIKVRMGGDLISKYEYFPSSLMSGALGMPHHSTAQLKGSRLGLRPKKTPTIATGRIEHIVNPCLYEHWSESYRLIESESEEKKLKQMGRWGPSNPGEVVDIAGEVYHIFVGLGIIEDHWLRNKKSPIIKLKSEYLERGYKTLEKYGLQKNDWFVSIHVRGSGYRDRYSEAEAIRNANIETYEKAIELVTQAGGWVIRQGDPVSMKPMRKMEKVIDYPHCEDRSAWMDIFLASQCKFLIGTSSGVYTIAKSFGVPILLTNLTPIFSAFSMSKNDIYLPKLYRDRKTQKYLNFLTMHDRVVGSYSLLNNFRLSGIDIEDNDEEDLYFATLQMLQQNHLIKERHVFDESLNEKFERSIAPCFSYYGKRTKLFAKCSTHFIQKHSDLLN
jgi:putative glycosyltransferase (TIGR04372 family)